MTIEILTGCGCSCNPYVGCDCTTTTTTSTTTTKAPGTLDCLDYFDIYITLPGNPWESLAGTYKVNRQGFPQDLNSDFWYYDPCYGACDAMGYKSENLAISLQVLKNPYVWDLFWRCFIYLYDEENNSWRQYQYGLAFTQGGFQMVDSRSCEGHCNGKFIGARASSSFTSWSSNSNYLGAFIKDEPGAFNIPSSKTWGAESSVTGGECGKCIDGDHDDFASIGVSYFFKKEFVIIDEVTGAVSRETYYLWNRIFADLRNGC